MSVISSRAPQGSKVHSKLPKLEAGSTDLQVNAEHRQQEIICAGHEMVKISPGSLIQRMRVRLGN
ncbi:hypothetical protein TRAPUB_5615 [Trametes pubescens]|uniref:Uncharacterized protein n=1 Tax=Trametes pubescens TaxID=154538 RepID=A0A1M2V8C0_TRAPU|nr:hypothetical protein TRAPUB_5615 [Trametes pubescens]